MMANVEWLGTPEQIEEAQRVREDEDLSYGQLAKRYGMADAAAMKAALASPVLPEPKSKLEAMVRDVEARAQAERDLYKGIEGEVDLARRDRTLTEDEVDQIERIYTSGARVRFKEIAAAIEPPVHWITVSEALGARGWATPTYQMVPYSTATKEGQRRLAEDRASGRVSPAAYSKAVSTTNLDDLPSVRI